ncbi:unnamed protein product [Effrenium voratum]|nr:unnamed protein product [Effrenium voratum]
MGKWQRRACRPFAARLRKHLPKTILAWQIPRSYKRLRRNRCRDARLPLAPESQGLGTCECSGQCEMGSCLNAIMLVECGSKTCNFGGNAALCRNRQFVEAQAGKREHLIEVFWTGATKGYGLRTLVHIAKGQLVAEYMGEIALQSRISDWRYVMSLPQGLAIDASKAGGPARFINHSCEPNCVAQRWLVMGRWRVGIFAAREIPPSEEVTFSYTNGRGGSGQRVDPCRCGSALCTGRIGQPPRKSRSAREPGTEGTEVKAVARELLNDVCMDAKADAAETIHCDVLAVPDEDTEDETEMLSSLALSAQKTFLEQSDQSMHGAQCTEFCHSFYGSPPAWQHSPQQAKQLLEDLVHGLAPSTTTVNLKAEQLQQEANEASPLSPKSPALSKADSRRLSVSVKADSRRMSIMMAPELKDIWSPEDASKSFDLVESSLQALKKNVRMEDVNEDMMSPHSPTAAKRAEERRKKELEARRNREKARNTKDPRRRVAAMLQQGREWGQARPDQVRDRSVKVPTQMHMALHNGGSERIEMVNVQALQGRCKGLSAGSCNYREVRNQAEEEERQNLWLQATAPAEPKDFIKENKAQLNFYVDSYEASRYQAEETEAKLNAAKNRRARADEAKLQRKIELLLGKKRIESATPNSPGSPQVMGGNFLRRLSAKACQESQSSIKQEPFRSPSMWSAVRGSLLETVDLKWQDRTIRKPSPKRTAFHEVLRRKIEKRKRYRSLRAVAQGACGFIALYVRSRRRYRAHDLMMHLFIRIQQRFQACEGIRKFNQKVRQVQRVFRGFLRRKRAWCKKASKFWMLIEDKHLADYYSYSENQSQDPLGRRVSGSRRASRPERIAHFGQADQNDLEPAWKVLRIPKEHRIFTLGRFYVLKAKHRQLQLGVCEDMRGIEVAAQRELEECFGLASDEADHQDLGNSIGHLFDQKGAWLLAKLGVAKHYAVEVDEEEMVGLIALAAGELQGRQPFQDHPANAVYQVQHGKTSAKFWRVIHRQFGDFKDNPTSPQRRSWGQLCRKLVTKSDKTKKQNVDTIMKRLESARLQVRKKKAVAAEDYAEAARVKRRAAEIESIGLQKDVSSYVPAREKLEILKQKAVAAEDFAEAGRLKRLLKSIENDEDKRDPILNALLTALIVAKGNPGDGEVAAELHGMINARQANAGEQDARGACAADKQAALTAPEVQQRKASAIKDSKRKAAEKSSDKVSKLSKDSKDVKDAKVEERKQCDSFWARGQCTADTVATHHLPCHRMQEVHKAAPLKSKPLWQHQKFSHGRPQPSRTPARTSRWS